MSPALLIGLALASSVLPRRAEDPVGWYAGDVFYEVFVRSFSDSDGDGHGDLRGLTAKLDVLKELGVDGLWLMPIYAGPTEHGYAVTSYDAIDPRYGTMDDALALIAAAHARGMAVLLDYVPNHVSAEHPWFVAAKGGDRLAEARFVVRDARPEGWTVPWESSASRAVWSPLGDTGRWYYHAFSPSMPDLELRDPAAKAWALRAADAWVERGADGFRVDAARYLVEDGPGQQADRPGSIEVLRELRARLAPSGAIAVTEAWTGSRTAARYLEAAQLTFDFDRAYALHRALSEGVAAPLEAAVRASEVLAPAGGRFAPFIDNHDGVVPRAASFGADAAVLANALVLTSGGVPFLWQGDEIGARAIDAELTRRPYRWEAGEKAGFTTGTPWTAIGGRTPGDDLASQRGDAKSVWRRTQAILQARRVSAALSFGVRYPVAVKGSAALWAFVKHDGRDRVLVVANLGEERARGTLAGVLGRAVRARDMLGGPALSPVIELGPREVRFYRLARAGGAGLVVRFGRPGMAMPPPEVAVDQGRVFDARRGMGFSRDVSGSLRCASVCLVRFERRDRHDTGALRWSAEVAPGAYRVEVEAAEVTGRGVVVEGLPMERAGRRLVREVFVHDGRVAIEAAAEGAAEVSGITITPAKVKAAAAEQVVAADRVVVRSREAGVVEWRMDGATAEPAERAALVRVGGRFFEAVLGPWAPGSVREVGWVIRGADGTYRTAAGGAEHVARLVAGSDGAQ